MGVAEFEETDMPEDVFHPEADYADVDDSSGFYSIYEAKEVLGTGMSSVVRRCIKKSTLKEYAVKILDVSSERATEEQAAELRLSTLREISILQALRGHRHIIEIHDFFETPTFLFIVFELCKGGELFDYLTRVVTLSEKKTRLVMRQLLQAVLEMHKRNIVHRDLKPENVLMETDDCIKLTDFGFAYQLGASERLYELCGTPGYLAPEILNVSMNDSSVGYGIEIDLWSIGVIMYTLLCGYAPFYHRKQIYMLRAIMEGRYEFRSPEWDEISPSAKDLIRNLLVIEPQKRLTAEQALKHPFLFLQPHEEFVQQALKYNARKKFKLAIVQIRYLVRLLKMKQLPIPIASKMARTNPYSAKKVRKQIDACAFHIYGHWVKRGREQHRDMLFANTLLCDQFDEEPETKKLRS